MTIAPREYDFHAARLRLETKAKSAGPKLGSLEEAIALVEDGDHLALGGCLYSRTPLALVWALLRRRPGHPRGGLAWGVPSSGRARPGPAAPAPNRVPGQFPARACAATAAFA